MTCKDYIRFSAMLKDMLADCANDNRDFKHNYYSRQAVKEVCQRTANIFAADNDRFDTDRFLRACGVKS
jgi:hypothetical protein